MLGKKKYLSKGERRSRMNFDRPFSLSESPARKKLASCENRRTKEGERLHA